MQLPEEQNYWDQFVKSNDILSSKKGANIIKPFWGMPILNLRLLWCIAFRGQTNSGSSLHMYLLAMHNGYKIESTERLSSQNPASSEQHLMSHTFHTRFETLDPVYKQAQSIHQAGLLHSDKIISFDFLWSILQLTVHRKFVEHHLCIRKRNKEKVV